MKAALTGGGTLGHVAPGTAVARRLAEEGVEVIWIGSRSPEERDFVLRRGIRFVAVSAGKLRRYWSWRNLATPFQVLAGYFQALAVLRRERPAVLFSKGGYVSVPVARAAKALGIPIVTHESDSNCGLATTLIARWAALVCLGDPRAEESLRRALGAACPPVAVTGNPVRDEILGGDGARFIARRGLPQGRPVVLVIGGSRGAAKLNEAIIGGMGRLGGRCSVVLLTGKGKKIPGAPSEAEGLWQIESLDSEMGDALAAASVVVSRAGAGAIAEIRALAKPSVLVPLGLDASRGDQIANALEEERAGRALVADEGAVVEKIVELVDNEALGRALSDACRRSPAADAAAALARLIIRVAEDGIQHG